MKLLYGILISLFLGQQVAVAQFPIAYGGYCSMTTASGQWGVWFGNSTINAACTKVYTNLWAVGATAVVRKVTGLIRLNAYNSVDVRCSNFWNTYFGYGIEPGNRAYREASGYGAYNCLFSVR